MEEASVFLPKGRRGLMLRWSVPVGTSVRRHQEIGRYKRRSNERSGAICAPCDGVLKELLCAPGDLIDAEQEVALVEFCPHHTDYNGLCALCGEDVTLAHHGGRRTRKVFTNALNVTERGMREFKSVHGEALLRHRKLLLVLDLDHTLLHASMHPVAARVLQHPTLAADTFSFRLRGDALHYVKLRPFLNEFLDRLKEKFDVCVFTWGVKEYARAVLRFLDPHENVVKNRIITRDDCVDSAPSSRGQPHQKSLERIFPCSPTMALIVDDTSAVWTESLHNLIEIQKFVFFPTKMEFAHGKSAIDANATTDLLDMSELEQNNRDNVLQSIANVLLAIYDVFFVLHSASRAVYPQPDVRSIYACMCSRVLSGAVLLLSGVVPQQHDERRSPIGRMALRLGARLQSTMDESTTHLVARRAGTEKVKAAVALDRIRVVQLDWLLHAAAHYYWPPEEHFQLDHDKDDKDKERWTPLFAPNVVGVEHHVQHALEALKTDVPPCKRPRRHYRQPQQEPQEQEEQEEDDPDVEEFGDALEAFMGAD